MAALVTETTPNPLKMIDFLFILIVFSFMLRGIRVGFASQAISLLFFAVSLIVLFVLGINAPVLGRAVGAQGIAPNLVLLFIGWLIVSFLLDIAARRMMARQPKWLFRSKINRALGALPAACTAIIFFALLCTLVMTLFPQPSVM